MLSRFIIKCIPIPTASKMVRRCTKIFYRTALVVFYRTFPKRSIDWNLLLPLPRFSFGWSLNVFKTSINYTVLLYYLFWLESHYYFSLQPQSRSSYVLRYLPFLLFITSTIAIQLIDARTSHLTIHSSCSSSLLHNHLYIFRMPKNQIHERKYVFLFVGRKRTSTPTMQRTNRTENIFHVRLVSKWTHVSEFSFMFFYGFNGRGMEILTKSILWSF